MQELDLDIKDIKKIVFACDVGMGSSAMGATNFRNRIKDFNLDIEVVNSSVANIPDDADIIITHKGLLDSIKKEINKDKIIFIENFLEDDNLEVLYEKLSKKNEGNEINAVEDLLEVENNTLLNEGNILLGLESESKEEAIIRAGELLFNNGYTKYEYIDSMLERENIISTYIGLGIAIPHGTESGKSEVEKAGIIVLQYPKGIKFGTQTAYLLIAVAAKHDEHLEIISSIAKSLEDIELIEKIKDIILECLDYEDYDDNYEVSLSFVDNKEIHQLNNEYRGIDRATDVLSFPLLVEDEFGIDFGEESLGDIVISLERAFEQSQEYNHSFEREVCFLVCHSMFHLLGYDHDTEENTKEMRQKEEYILNKLGITRE